MDDCELQGSAKAMARNGARTATDCRPPAGAAVVRRSRPSRTLLIWWWGALLAFGVGQAGVRADAALGVWGENSRGQGVVPEGLQRIVAIACGAYQNLAIRADGRVFVWGDIHRVSAPLDLTGIQAVACGATRNLALRQDGRVLDWLVNDPSLLGFSPMATPVTAIAAGGDHYLALTGEGGVVAWGDSAAGLNSPPADLTHAIAIACGKSHNLALTVDGRVVAWGDNSGRQLEVPAGLDQVRAIAANGSHSLALRADGSVVGWGSWGGGPRVETPGPLTGIVAIAAGPTHALAVREDGVLLMWNESGTVVVPTNFSRVVAAAAGAQHVLALSGEASPWLSTPLLDRVLPLGEELVLQIDAVGSPPLHFQWQFEGEAIPGETNRFLRRPRMEASLAGRYSVTVSNAFGTVRSPEARVSGVPLVFLSQPESQYAYRGGSATLKASVRGVGPWLFQWEKDGEPISGATHESLSLEHVTQAQAGFYTLRAENSYGVVRSDTVRVAVGQVAVLGWSGVKAADMPDDLTNIVAVATGGRHCLALRANGKVTAWGANEAGQATVPADLTDVVAIAAGRDHSGALRRDGTAVLWGNSESALRDGQGSAPDLRGAGIAACADHTLLLDGEGGFLAWGEAPGIPGSLNGPYTTDNGMCNYWRSTLPPVAAVALGRRADVGLLDDGRVLAWFFFNDSPSTSWTPLSNIVEIASAGSYVVGIRDNGGLSVWPIPWATPGGDRPPTSPAGLTNSAALASSEYCTYALQADGTVSWWYAYALDRDYYSNGLANVVAIAAAEATCLALVGDGPPYVRATTPDRQVLIGSCALFRATATGAYPLTYQWRRDGVALPGATNATLLLTDLRPDHTGAYSLVVSNAFGTVTTADARLEVLPFFLRRQPSSVNALPGDVVWLGVSCEGESPFTYQWRREGENLPKQTNSTLILTNAQMAQSGRYDVLVSNPRGTLTSAVAQVQIVPALFERQPASQAVASGANVTLSFLARGPEPLAYQWRFNGVDIPGATGTDLTLTHLGTSQVGVYSVVVSNAYGVVESAPATVSLPAWVAWGDNRRGQTDFPSDLPAVAALAAGAEHNLALLPDGRVVGWGANGAGQADVPADLRDVVAVAAGQAHSLALKADGSVVGWGWNDAGQAHPPAQLSGVVGIAAGASFNLALRAEGSVVGWGARVHGETVVPAGLDDVMALAAGDNFALALRADGTVVGWGDNTDGQAAPPAGLTGVVALAAGARHALALRADGSVVGWGFNGCGQVDVPTNLTRVRAIAAGGYASFAVREDGALVGWGSTDFGHLSYPTNLNRVCWIVSGANHAVALLGDPAPPPAWTRWSGGPGSWLLDVPAQRGRAYWIEYKDDLSEPWWRFLPRPPRPGDGATQSFTLPFADTAARFYRIGAQ